LTRVFRLLRGEHADTAFSGQGAARRGGRWNPAGVPIVYTAQSLSLAALELLVHMEAEDFGEVFVYFDIEIPDSIELLAVDPGDLGPIEREGLDYPALQEVGRQWVESQQSVGLWVPSAVIPSEYNLLLDPEHPEFEALSIAGPQAFSFDTRLKPQT
jgi:RES domain-containing protein